MLRPDSRFQSYPKIELHLHLDCSVTWTALQRLGTTLTRDQYLSQFVAPEECTSLKQYLDAIAPSCALLQTTGALRIATAELIAELDQDGVIYAELRFAPQTHLSDGLTLDEVMEAVVAGVAEGKSGRAIDVGLILCALRDYSAEQNLAVIDLAHRWTDRGVVGVDIAGDEAGHALAPNYVVFERAHALGLNITAHAGEAAGADSVAEVLTHLNPQRIGHGVRCLENDDVVQMLKERGTHLEVCPSSNVQVGVCADFASHPIDTLSRRGLSLGVNTDARTVAPISLSLEYERLEAAFGWGRGEFLAHNLEAARNAFQPQSVRDALCRQLVAAWQAENSIS
ncbi:adenosine deaminase [Devosia sp. XK-2]|uniref:adenosine deaminase n=1 Tax=Devosia sp. XK-2 TaxID=3126689 RepID=UPI0030D50C7C